MEVTEIVQPRLKQRAKGELKTANDSQKLEEISALTLDTNAIIFLFDPRKKYTFEYVKNEISKIPAENKQIDILIVSNFTDVTDGGKERKVSTEESQEFIEE